MKIAATTPSRPATARSAAGRGRGARADVIYNWDHFYPLYGNPTASTSSVDDARQLGQGHDRVEIGCLVTCNSYRNRSCWPTWLARSTTSPTADDHGYQRPWLRDYDDFGYEFGGGSVSTPCGRSSASDQPHGHRQPGTESSDPILIGGGGEETLNYVCSTPTSGTAGGTTSGSTRTACSTPGAPRTGRTRAKSNGRSASTPTTSRLGCALRGLAAANVHEVTIAAADRTTTSACCASSVAGQPVGQGGEALDQPSTGPIRAGPWPDETGWASSS